MSAGRLRMRVLKLKQPEAVAPHQLSRAQLGATNKAIREEDYYGNPNYG